MLPRVSSLGLAGLAFAAGVAATLAVVRDRGDAPAPRPPAAATAPMPIRVVAAAVAPACAAEGRERPGCAPGAETPDEERRRAAIRDDLAQTERDLAEEVAAGRAAAEGAPSEAEALGRAVARADRTGAPPAEAPVEAAAGRAPVRPPEPAAAASRIPRVAEVVRRRPAEPARALRPVASAEGGIMRWLNTPGSF